MSVHHRNTTLQESFLNQARIQKVPVTIYLRGPEREILKGYIKGFDDEIIMLDVSGKYNLVYKHAISTVIPLKPVISFRDEDEINIDLSKTQMSGEA